MFPTENIAGISYCSHSFYMFNYVVICITKTPIISDSLLILILLVVIVVVVLVVALVSM
jgi:hypothetical protein